MVRTRGLKHININVRDLGRSLAFYQKILGLEIESRHGDAMIFLHTPGARDVIALCQAKNGDKVGIGGVTHFGWQIESEAELEGAERDITAAGGKVISRGHHSPREPFLYFEDPDGYVIELFGSPS